MNVVENVRVNPFQSDRSKTVAFVSCKVNTEIGAIYLQNMTLINGSKGLFLSKPSRKLPKPDKDGKQYQDHYFFDRALSDAIRHAAIEQYNQKTGQPQQQNMSGGGYGPQGHSDGGYGGGGQ